MSASVDRVVSVLRHHVEIGSQRGAQIYVSVDGRTVLDVGVGTTESGTAITPEHIFPWLGATRTLVSILIAQLVENDSLSLDDTVGAHVPGAGARANCTIRHLLTHLGGFPSIDTSDVPGTDEQLLGEAFTHPAAHTSGRRAHYHRSGSWRVLGEVAAAVTGTDVTTLIRQRLWEPLGMDASYLALTDADLDRLGDWLVLPELGDAQHRGWTGRASLPATLVERRRAPGVLARVDPDLGGHGPAHDLARPFEALVTGGPTPIRDQLMVELLSTPQRAPLRDGGFSGERVPWGMGLMVAGAFAGTVGYRCFGHDGLPGGRVLCDPDEGLVMVFLTSGLVGPGDDARRLGEVTDAVYDMAAPTARTATITSEVQLSG